MARKRQERRAGTGSIRTKGGMDKPQWQQSKWFYGLETKDGTFLHGLVDPFGDGYEVTIREEPPLKPAGEPADEDGTVIGRRRFPHAPDPKAAISQAAAALGVDLAKDGIIDAGQAMLDDSAAVQQQQDDASDVALEEAEATLARVQAGYAKGLLPESYVREAQRELAKVKKRPKA